MTIKMCDLSAHVYRTSYIYKYIYRLPVWLWRVSTYTFLRSLHTRPLQQTINGSCRVSVKHRLGSGSGSIVLLFRFRFYVLVRARQPKTKQKNNGPRPRPRVGVLLTPDRVRTDCRSYGLYRPYTSTGLFDSLYQFVDTINGPYPDRLPL